MLYPHNFEDKTGFNQIRTLLDSKCLSALGKEMVDAMSFSDDADTINEWQRQIGEFRRITEEHDDFPMDYFFDVREAITRVRPENTHIEEPDLFDLMRSLSTIDAIVSIINDNDDSHTDSDTDSPLTPHPSSIISHPSPLNHSYPALKRLTEDIITFPQIVRRISSILDKNGRVKDGASFALANIRDELKRTNGKISATLNTILHRAKIDGLVGKDTAPTMRDGRLMLPVPPQAKRKITGIVHDESATGRTVFIEPAEVVEINNHIRELEAEEQRELIRILTDFTNQIRPYIKEIVDSFQLLARIDFLQAKLAIAKDFDACEVVTADHPQMDWVQARHPLLQKSLERQNRKIVPLDIKLTPENRIMIISGPNAGGKSICLKTTGLLQYMLQCGLAIPVRENSKFGIFKDIMIDIGDEQSIENDLSTYSSHLVNMKTMMKQSDGNSLLLIDEFGGGTEPQIGGALAESFLDTFCKKGAWAVITTHYQNLKQYADNNPGVVNAAMLYDRAQMKPLFQLEIGNPGSSFAIEIARNIGLPENVIQEASDKVGHDYVQSDKYLQEIMRDKRYWERKRQNIHQQEKEIERQKAEYEAEMSKIKAKRREILEEARDQAQRLLKESNARIERTIKEIKEAQADKEATKKIRQELQTLNRDAVALISDENQNENLVPQPSTFNPQTLKPSNPQTLKTSKPQIGSYVKIKGQEIVGQIESINAKSAICIFGQLKTQVRISQLEPAEKPKSKSTTKLSGAANSQAVRKMREEIDQKRNHFKPDLDIRGLRGEEAINAVTYFIDDAIMIGMPTVRILHGKGDGILRHLVRQYLSTIKGIKSFRDENIQFGGTGITVVEI